jgi:DNA-binding CsgD family transcriptional regulator
VKTVEELLLALYRAATEVAEAEFAPYAAGLVRGLMEFDSASCATMHMACRQSVVPSDHIDAEQPIASRQNQLVELLAPHLQQAIKINRALSASPASPLRPSSAILRLNGVLQYAAPAFSELLKQEWPDWQGERMPAQLLTALRTGPPIVYNGRGIIITGRISFDLILLRGSALSPLTHLSAREKEAAMLFGAGKSTKEIARSMEVSHNSVRNFVQRAYKKLGVGDKAQLAVLIGAWPAPAP